MKLYKITAVDENDVRRAVAWRTSEGDARKLKTAINKEHKHDHSEAEIEAIEVQTTRNELVTFLNNVATPLHDMLPKE